VRAYATNAKGTAYGEQKTFTTKTEQITPTVTTGDITDITTTTATCSGNVTAEGESAVTARGACWSTSQNPTTANSKTTDGTGKGAFTSNLTGLTPNTTYYVSAYATNAKGTAYGEQKTFTTKSEQTTPTVTTGDITDITTTTATCSGNVTADGGTAVTARGVCWSTSQDPATANSKTTDGTGVGTFTSNLTGLSPNTTYYVRAYATNSEGTAYGEQTTFTTLSGSDIIFGSFTDSRDGNVYVTVTIGEQTWMAENLAYLPSVSPPNDGGYIPHYYVHGYYKSSVSEAKATDNYNIYGVLYNWEAAMSACPEGWHLPSDSEWYKLKDYLAHNGYCYDGSTGYEIAKAMASESGWALSNVTGSVGNTDYPEYRNKSGFSALPGGRREYEFSLGYSRFVDLEYEGNWWTSTGYDNWDGASSNSLHKDYANVVGGGDIIDSGLSVRCVKSPEQTKPTVTTGEVTNIATTTATCPGNVTADGGAAITARGVCWASSQNPTTANSKTNDGTGVGTFTSNLTGLTPNTTYYVRAYATNAIGTAYGEQRTFKTNQEEMGDTFTDSRDGNVYKTVTIGEQVWMEENLAYLPSVVGPATGSKATPCYYVYGYDGTNVSAAKATNNYNTYGVLYNQPAAMTACPVGWRLPSDTDWTQLENYLADNGYNYDGSTGGGRAKIAKSLASASGWNSHSWPGSVGNTDYPAYRNKSGFSALPGGNVYGKFESVGYEGTWWSSSEISEYYAWVRHLYYNASDIRRTDSPRENGHSVRCVWNE